MVRNCPEFTGIAGFIKNTTPAGGYFSNLLLIMEPLAGEFAVYFEKILNTELVEGLETSISEYPDSVKFSTVPKLAATYSRAILRWIRPMAQARCCLI